MDCLSPSPFVFLLDNIRIAELTAPQMLQSSMWKKYVSPIPVQRRRSTRCSLRYKALCVKTWIFGDCLSQQQVWHTLTNTDIGIRRGKLFSFFFPFPRNQLVYGILLLFFHFAQTWYFHLQARDTWRDFQGDKGKVLLDSFVLQPSELMYALQTVHILNTSSKACSLRLCHGTSFEY